MINKSRLIKLTKKLISIDSQNPPGNEVKIAEFIKKDMLSLGLGVKEYSYVRNRPNIIATLKGSLPRKTAKKESLLLTPHIDTVPIGKGWKYDPFASEIINGKLYGRGTTDDKGNLAASMEVMRSLVEDKVKLKKDVVFAATADEETGSKLGIIPLLDKKVLKPGFALILDSDEFDSIIAQKGLFHFEVQILGKKAHGAYNWRGVNAIEQAARVIELIKGIRFKHDKHPLLKGPTVNIGTIKGGEKVNMVADYCEFSVDCRFTPDMDAKKIKKMFESEIKKVTKKYKILVRDIQQPYEIKKDHPCVKLYVKTARQLGYKAKLKGSEGATVITFFKKHNIPAFATGFGAHGTAHTNDEYIKVETLYNGTRILEKYVKEYDNLEV